MDSEQQIAFLDAEIEKLRKEIERLERRELMLEMLEQWGVDNWIGYDEAMYNYREILAGRASE